MKKTIGTLLILAVLMAFAFTGFLPAEKISAEALTLWTFDMEDGNTMPLSSFDKVSTESYLGTYSLLLDPQKASTWGLELLPEITPGTEYTFAAMVKTVDYVVNGSAWQLWAQQGGAGNVVMPAGSNDWALVSMTFTAEDIANHKFGFFNFGDATATGSVYIDNIAIGQKTLVDDYLASIAPVVDFDLWSFGIEDGQTLPLSSFDKVSTESYTGTYSLLLDPQKASTWGLEMLPELTPGTEYTFAAMVKTVDYVVNGSAWQLWAQQGGAGNVVMPAGSNDWALVSMTFTAEDIANHKFGFFNFGDATATGSVYIDNIAFGLTADVEAYYEGLAEGGETDPTAPAAEPFEMWTFDMEDAENLPLSSFARVSDITYSGDYALMVDPTIFGSWGLELLPEITAGVSYTFGAMIRTVDYFDGGRQWLLWAQQPAAGNVQFPDGNNDWEWYSMTFTAQDLANHKFGFFNFGMGEATGLVYIDNIAFGETDDVTAYKDALTFTGNDGEEEEPTTEPDPTDTVSTPDSEAPQTSDRNAAVMAIAMISLAAASMLIVSRKRSADRV